MEPRAHHVLIGLFTVLAVAGAVWFGLWLAKGGIERASDYYDIVFSEEVFGLSVGSNVRYTGIRVGDVQHLGLDPDDPRRVVARIRVRPDTPIKQDTRAELAATGIITGTTHVQLSGGSPESPRLTAPRGEVPVIIAQPSPIARLRAGSDELFDGITTLIQRGNELLSPQNTARFARALTNIEQTTGVLAEQQQHLREGIEALAQAGAQANHALQEASQAMAQASALMSNATQMLDGPGAEILSSAGRAMRSAEHTAERLEALLDENEESLGVSLQGMRDLGPAIQELRITLAALRTLTQRIEDDPSGFLLGRDGVQGFEP